MTGWETVKLPQKMVEKIDKFVDSDFAEEYGFTSRSQVVVEGMREFLEKWRRFSFYLKSPKYGKLKFNKVGPFILCARCKSQVCVHAVDLFRHKRLFDFDILEDGSILSGVDYDKKPDDLLKSALKVESLKR